MPRGIYPLTPIVANSLGRHCAYYSGEGENCAWHSVLAVASVVSLAIAVANKYYVLSTWCVNSVVSLLLLTIAAECKWPV